MTTNQKEEDMGNQRKGLARIFLLAGVGVLLYVFTCAICGCGSNEKPPLSRQDKEPAVSAKPQVQEVLPKPHPGAAVPQGMVLGREKPDETEVIPPETPGGRGLTAAEVKAREAAAEPIDPRFNEVIPPAIPGGRGLTAAEVKARIEAAEPTDSERIEVIPPATPGGRGLTAAEIDAAKPGS